MDIAYLNNIQIKTSNNLIRQYNFNYNWTPRIHSTAMAESTMPEQ